MSKNVLDAVLDLMLVAGEGDQLHVNSAQPTTPLEADTTFNLATIAITGGDFTKAAGDVSGRKNTIAQKLAVAITSTGTANHVSITDNAGADLIRVTTAPSQLLTSGGDVDIGSHKQEIQQAV